MKSVVLGGMVALSILLLWSAAACAQSGEPAIVDRRPAEATARNSEDPGSAKEAQENGRYLVLRDETYVERPSGPLTADIYMPRGEGPFPGMLVVHGGAWASGSKRQLAFVAARLAAKGYTAMAISYRLAPRHKFPAQIHDCKAAVRWLRMHAARLKVDPERIGGFGYSAGGHLVALLGATSPEDGLEDAYANDASDAVTALGLGTPPSTRLQVVVAGGAPCNFQFIPERRRGLSFWLGARRSERPDLYAQAAPVTYASPDDPPMFFFHGEHDDLVPISSPRQMVEALAAAGVASELYEVQRGGHLTSTFHLGAIERAEAFAARHLKETPVASAARGVSKEVAGAAPPPVGRADARPVSTGETEVGLQQGTNVGTVSHQGTNVPRSPHSRADASSGTQQGTLPGNSSLEGDGRRDGS